jgi:NAD(P)-dependent dehydrogenase (short-subunit alcohol dehydrogenase family)
MDLRERIALFTGASIGIGYATAQCLAEAGADREIGYGHKEQATQALAEHIRQMGQRAVVLLEDMHKPAHHGSHRRNAWKGNDQFFPGILIISSIAIRTLPEVESR